MTTGKPSLSSFESISSRIRWALAPVCLFFVALACVFTRTGDSPVEDGSIGSITREISEVRRNEEVVETIDPLNNHARLRVLNGGVGLLEFGSDLSLRLFNSTDAGEITGTRTGNDPDSPIFVQLALFAGGFSGQLFKSGSQAIFNTPNGAQILVQGTEFFVVYNPVSGVTTAGNFSGSMGAIFQDSTIVIPAGNSVEIGETGIPGELSPIQFTMAEFEDRARNFRSPVLALDELLEITPTFTPTPVITLTDTAIPSLTPTYTPTPSITPTHTWTPTVTPTPTPPLTVIPPPLPAGEIVFASDRVGDREIYTMNSDGSGVTRLTFSAGDDNHPEWSEDGEWIAFASERDGSWGIYYTEPSPLRVSYKVSGIGGANDFHPDWSPDGGEIAFESNRDGNLEIYVTTTDIIDGPFLRQLTFNPAQDECPDWSPDASQIAFASDRDGNREIYLMAADGSEQTRITFDPSLETCPTWSPDGREIAFHSDRDGDEDIYIMNADGSDTRQLTQNAASDWGPAAWSPDGDWLAFLSNRTGDWEIFLIFIDGGQEINLTNNPAYDAYPAWFPGEDDDID